MHKQSKTRKTKTKKLKNWEPKIIGRSAELMTERFSGSVNVTAYTPHQYATSLIRGKRTWFTEKIRTLLHNTQNRCILCIPPNGAHIYTHQKWHIHIYCADECSEQCVWVVLFHRLTTDLAPPATGGWQWPPSVRKSSRLLGAFAVLTNAVFVVGWYPHFSFAAVETGGGNVTSRLGPCLVLSA